MPEHIHSYIKRGKVWACCIPMCSHYITTHILIEGRQSLCPICKEKTLIITKEDMRRKKPRCVECSKTKRKETFSKAKSLMDTILNEQENILTGEL